MPKKEQKSEQGLPSLSLAIGYLAIKDLEKQRDQMDVLDRLGYGNVEIARICGTTPDYVRVVKSRLKVEQSRRRR